MSYGIMRLAANTLLAQQTAMQVVGHNIANAETDGYVRQVAVMEPIPGATHGTVASAIGQGARISTIKRLQHAFIAIQTDRQAALLGREAATEDMLSQVEAVYTEFTETGIVDNLGLMFNAFEAIGTDPTSLAARQETVVRAELLADIIRDRQQSLYSLRTDADERLSDNVAEANRLAYEIADLNKKIGAAGSDAVVNDLKGLREAAMSQLAELTGAYCLEQPNDQVDVMIGGRRMVQLAEVTELSVQLDPTNPGMHKLCLGSVEDPEGLGGTVMGLIDARDGQIMDYLDRMDTFAATLADEINALHTAGFDLNGTAGVDFFTYNPDSPASTLQVNPAIAADPELIAAARDASAVGDGSNASAIALLRDTKIFAGGLLNPTEYYADLIAQVGTDTKAAADMVLARESVVESLRANYQALSGVSLDEEAVDLLRYQQVYNAAAHLLQTSIELMDTLFAIS